MNDELNHADELEALRARCDEYLQGWKRATADYQNLKKEMESERLEFAGHANVKALLHFIPIYDNLQKAAAAVPDDQKGLGWVVGIMHILKQYEDVFRQYGLERIPTVGQQFDPEIHEALSEESADGSPPGTVIRELASGYRMNGTVLVPAKVVVSK